MVRFLGQIFLFGVSMVVFYGLLIFGVLQMLNQLGIEGAEQPAAQIASQKETQAKFSQEDCRQAMNGAEKANAGMAVFADAIKICRHVAAWGDVDTQFYLGVLYQQGKKVEKDKEESARWFEAAARQGHVVAQFEMMGIYLARAYEAEKADSNTGIFDLMDAYGWLCVLEKQVSTPGSPGLAIWNDPESKYGERLQRLSQNFAQGVDGMLWPIRIPTKNRCRDYVKTFYKNPTL